MTETLKRKTPELERLLVRVALEHAPAVATGMIDG